jgi:hypothetical protein
VAEAAGEVRRHLGLDPAAPVARNLARLVSYLRRFDGGELPASPGLDPYRQLALGRRGVCRHRAYVFVVTAQSLGLPAQLVENEVHAFAEVLLPEAGWLRVDLGGQVVEGLDEVAGPVHQPQRQDPFAWPDSAGRSRRSARRRGQRSPSVETSRSGSRNGSFSPGEPQPTVAAPRRSEWRRALPPDGESSAVAPEPIAPEPAWSVRLDTPRPRVLRGEPLLVTGQVEYDGQGTAVAAVEVRVVHYSQGAETILGLLPVGDEGRFRGELAVPSTLVVGRYSLLVRVVPDWQSVNEDRVATPR